MQSNRAVVFANGDFKSDSADTAQISVNDFLVCVDGGTRHCLSLGLTPNLLVGDLDSVDKPSLAAVKASDAECIRFAREKDASDLELVLDILADRFFEEVVLLGASGGRTDHLLFNWQLAAAKSWPFQLRIIDAYVDAFVVDNRAALNMQAPEGQLFSVVPMAGTATGVVVTGAQYPLESATLKVGSTVGLSNKVTDAHLQVSVEEGIVLVMLVHTEH